MDAFTWVLYLVWGIALVWLVQRLRRHRSTQKQAVKAGDAHSKRKSVGPVGIAIGVALALLFIFVGVSQQNGPGAFDEFAAHQLCVKAIKTVARDPDKAEIPRVRNFGSEGNFLFDWGSTTKLIRMRNGLGLDVAATGTCGVNTKLQSVTHLTLDGKVLISSLN